MTIEEIDQLKPRKAVLYLRVSSKRQTETAIDIDKDGNSIATQREVCREKANALNADIVEEFVEPGVSAQTIEKRPVFKALLAYLNEHRDVDFVIVYARSRAFRNFVDAAITRRHLDKLDVRLISAREDFGEGTYAEAMEAVTDIMNQVQNQLSGEDIRIKMRNKAINGGTVSKARLGYLNIRKDIDGRMINSIGLDEKRAPLVLKAFELYATGNYTIERLEATMADLGLTTRRTARTAEQPVSASKLHAMLKDPSYVGYVVYKGEIYPGRHEPIVGQDLFDEVQDVMAARSGAGTRDRVHNHYLKGMMFCAKCHRAGRTSRMIYVRAKGRGNAVYEYYFCRARQEGECDLPHIPVHVIEDEVAKTYDSLRLDPDFEEDARQKLTSVIEGEQMDIRAVRAQLTNEQREIELKEARLIDMLVDDMLPQSKIRAKLHELRVQRLRVEDRLANLTEQLVAGGRVLDAALTQATNPKQAYLAASEKTRRLLNESYYKYFRVDERGSVVATLDDPFDGIFAAQRAYRAGRTARIPTTDQLVRTTVQTAPDGHVDARERRSQGNKNGADFSTPSLLFNLASIYSNHDSNKATLVGLTGFEPATP